MTQLKIQSGHDEFERWPFQCLQKPYELESTRILDLASRNIVHHEVPPTTRPQWGWENLSLIIRLLSSL